jgi:hypothetical protein
MDNHTEKGQYSAQASGQASSSVTESQGGGVRRQSFIPAPSTIHEYDFFDAVKAEDQAQEITLQDLRKYLRMHRLPYM